VQIGVRFICEVFDIDNSIPFVMDSDAVGCLPIVTESVRAILYLIEGLLLIEW